MPLDAETTLDAFFTDLESNWSSAKAASLLDANLIKQLDDGWYKLSLQRKIRAATALFHLRAQERIRSQDVLFCICNKLDQENNEFLVKFSRLLRPFLASGFVDVSEVDSETAWRVANDLLNKTSTIDDRSNQTACFSNSANYPWLSCFPTKPSDTEVALHAGVTTNLFNSLESINTTIPYSASSKLLYLITDVLQNDDELMAWDS